MAVIRTATSLIVNEIFRPSLSLASLRLFRTSSPNFGTTVRLPCRRINYSSIRCAASGSGDAGKKVSSRLSQVKELLHEAQQRASSAGNEPIPKITLDHVTVSFARSGGGQNVNKGLLNSFSSTIKLRVMLGSQKNIHKNLSCLSFSWVDPKVLGAPNMAEWCYRVLNRRYVVWVPFFVSRFYHFGSDPGIDSLNPSSSQKIAQHNVGIFWDLDNKPPKSFPPYNAAIGLKKAAASLGIVRHMVAYANRHAFTYVPPVVREQRRERKELNHLESKGIVKPAEPYICRVCGRIFYTNDKLLNHFKQIHESEQRKRLNQIDSARGTRRVKLVAKFSMKMEKYKNASRDVLTPKVGYGLADELKRAGFWVRTVSNKPQAADIALRNHMVDMMDRRLIECLVLVSDDSDFVEVLKEAKLRCLKTVVVGDSNDGALKRTSNAAFSWQEIMLGKAKKEAVSVVGRWKDRDVLKRLEWTYNPEVEKKLYDWDDETEDPEIGGFLSGEDDDCMQKEDGGAWWELDSDAGVTSS